MSWKQLGAVAPSELVDARLQLHHAVQIAASAGASYLTPRPDDSHPNLGWVESLGALVGHAIPTAEVRVGLRVANASLVLLDAADVVIEELPLDGATREGGYSWLTAATIRAGAAIPAAGITRANYEIPRHAVEGGESFDTRDGAAFAELARWFANAQYALGELAARTPGASDLRCWPHHFDLGALVTLATNPDGNLSKSIGIGLSPGDDSYAEPYWYVSPWPYPEPDVLPALESLGHWHTEGHTSAILTGSDLLDGPPDRQSDRLRAFFEAAMDASRNVLAS